MTGGTANYDLRATAAEFVPNFASGREKSSPPQAHRNTRGYSNRKTINKKKSNVDLERVTVENTNFGSALSNEDHTQTSTLECSVCVKLGLALPCCRALTGSCSHCTMISEAFDTHKAKSNDKVAALQHRNTQLETETAKQRYKRLPKEKDTEIENLKSEVDAVQKEDQRMKAQMKTAKVDLDRLKDELLELQPERKAEERQKFFIKEAKQKKGRNK